MEMTAHPPMASGTARATAPLDLRQIKFDPRWALQTPPGLMVRRRFLPLLRFEGRLIVAVERQLEPSIRQWLERLGQAPVEPVLATTHSIRELQSRLFGDLREAATLTQPVLDPQQARSDADAEDATALFDQLLTSAILRQASDMHFNTSEEGTVQIRLRVDGELIDDVQLPGELRLPVYNRVKVLAGLDIAEKRAAQDGSFRYEAPRLNKRIEVRVATIPARHGERITLRLLAVDQDLLTLPRLGMEADHQQLFADAITLSHGMILMTGPTGSGKSTTLYAGLKHVLEGGLRNVMTVEDPIEYEIEGVTQTEIDGRREKVSFASSLRSILRHDPDVIMVGEIRDRETAELAIRAALTGHLVLSTLHTNTAAGAVTRLLDLGIDRYLLASVLRLVAAQRLVRTLCPFCREAIAISPDEALYFNRFGRQLERAYRSPGCLYCAGKGFAGRSGLFEMIPIGIEESEHIHSSSAQNIERTLLDCARNRGLPSLLEDGLRKINAGTTTPGEVTRVTAEFA